MEISRTMTMRELKTHADSLHTSSNPEDREEGQLWYTAGMSRPRENFTPQEWELLAAMYSNYASNLIFRHDNSVLAYSYLLEAIRIEREKCPADYSLCSAYVSMGRIYLNYGNTGRAISVFKEGLERNLRSRSPQRANYSFANILSELWGIGALDSIDDVVDEWVRRPVNDSPASRFCSLHAKAAVAVRERDYRRAEACLLESLGNIDVEFGPDSYRDMTLLMLFDVSLRAGDTAGTRKYMELTKKINRNDDDFYNISWHNRLMEKYYRMTGREDLAERVRISNLQLKDSLYNARNHTLISELELKHITLSLNEDLKDLERERQILESSNRSQKTVIWVIAINSTLLILLLLWLLYKSRKLRETNTALFRKNVEIIKATGIQPFPSDSSDSSDNSDSSVYSDSSDNSDSSDSSDSSESFSYLLSVYEKVTAFCNSGKEIYDPEFNIETLSELTELRHRDISQAINTVAGKNFRTFIMEYRIREACRVIMETEKNGEAMMKMDVLGENVGFRSRPHFSATFKAVTGMTCTDFIREVRKGNLTDTGLPFSSPEDNPENSDNSDFSNNTDNTDNTENSDSSASSPSADSLN